MAPTNDPHEFWTLAPQIITAFSVLAGTLLGGLITFFTQRWLHNRDGAEKRRTLAASLAAELDAYLDLMKRRDHVRTASLLLDRLKQGHDVALRGWANANDKPLDQFPIFAIKMGEIGDLGSDCFALGKFYSLIAGVRSTVIDAERGKYDRLTLDEKIELLEGEIAIWNEAIHLGQSLLPILKKIARIKSSVIIYCVGTSATK